MDKAHDAFRTISEVALELGVPKHVLRFWESKFPQIKPMKRGGGRRYYRPEDLLLLSGIRTLLHSEGYTIKGVQKILREKGVDAVKAAGQNARRDNELSAPKARHGRGRLKVEAHSRKNSGKALAADGFSKLGGGGSPGGPGVAAVDEVIRELESCRDILLGKPHPPSAKTNLSRKQSVVRSA